MSTEPLSPEHLDLDQLIGILEAHDSDKVVKLGFGKPHSYRGYYDDLAFEPAGNVTVGAMLAAARSALGKTFQGYKGGDYEMGTWTSVWLAEYGNTGESLGRILLSFLLTNVAADPLDSADREVADSLIPAEQAPVLCGAGWANDPCPAPVEKGCAIDGSLSCRECFAEHCSNAGDTDPVATE